MNRGILDHGSSDLGRWSTSLHNEKDYTDLYAFSIHVINSTLTAASIMNGTMSKGKSIRNSINVLVLHGMHREGVEPSYVAWKATILPLNHRCKVRLAGFEPTSRGSTVPRKAVMLQPESIVSE